MKKTLSILFLIFFTFHVNATDKPRVFIFTDINIDAGDPDDRQSLAHLMWYANELEIEGIVPDRIEYGGYEACNQVLQTYVSDFVKYDFEQRGFTSPDEMKGRVAKSAKEGKEMFYRAATSAESPLYVLIWGNMNSFRDALLEKPGLSKNIRLITIGTGLMLERSMQHIPERWEKHPPCKQMNWNGKGRNDIYYDSRFYDMWWIEMNWTYAGMFSGEEPKEMLQKLSQYGSLGQHIKDVVKKEAWAQYFRVGDTPSVLYVIDSSHKLDDPTQSSWAGRFVKPFPENRPNYYTDFSGDIEWNYENPCITWENHEKVGNVAAGTLEKERAEMYEALLKKLESLY